MLMDEFKIKVKDKEHDLKLKKVADGEYQVLYDGSVYEVSIIKRPQENIRDSHYRKENNKIYIDSMIGGIVLKVTKKVGDKVSEGDTIMTLIAMKTETDIKAPESGILSNISAYEGTVVEKGELLFLIDTE